MDQTAIIGIVEGIVSKALENSHASFGISDMLLLAIANILGTATLFVLSYFFFSKFVLPKQSNGGPSQDTVVANEAHKLVITKDTKGVYLFLRIPEYFEKFVEYVKNIDDHFGEQNNLLREMYNHQNDRLRKLEDNVK